MPFPDPRRARWSVLFTNELSGKRAGHKALDWFEKRPLAQGAVAFEGVDQGAPRRRKSFCSHKFAV